MDYFTIDKIGLPVDADALIVLTFNKALKKPTDFDYGFRLKLVEEQNSTYPT